MKPPSMPSPDLPAPRPTWAERLNWPGKLRRFMLVSAFCLGISLVTYAFRPDHPYAPSLVYSLCIGLASWLLIDLGRHAFPSAADTGWPRGWIIALVVAGGVGAGAFFGIRLADAICVALGLYSAMPMDPVAELRQTLLISAIAGISVSYYFYSRGRSAYLTRKVTQAESHANEARLKLLETQLEPHMLFNTLANLRALIAVDPPRAQEMLDRVIAYLRATLDASRATTHPLHAEFERLRDYLELMAVRMGPRLAFELELPPDVASLAVPTLLLQPLVENSIRHGLEPKVEGGRIRVSARRDGDRLLIEVSDTGVGQAAADAERQGFGLAQVRERLAALYGAAATFAFEGTPGGGARARISLPVPA